MADPFQPILIQIFAQWFPSAFHPAGNLKKLEAVIDFQLSTLDINDFFARQTG